MATEKEKSESSVLDTLDFDNIDRQKDDNTKSNNSEKEELDRKQKEKEEEEKKKQEEEEKQNNKEENKDDSDKEKDKEDDEPAGDDEVGLNSIAKKLGFFEEAEIKELGLTDTEEGIVKLVSTAVEKQKETWIDEALSSHEDLKALKAYVDNGGNPEDFYRARVENVKYSSITIEEKDVAMQKTILKEYLAARGYSKEEIEEEIKEADDSGMLYKKSTRFLEVLKKDKAKEEEELSANLEKQKQEAQEASRQLWEEIETTVTKATTLKGIPLSPASKKELLDYVRIGKEGSSKYHLDLAELKAEEAMALAYIVKNKLDFSSVFKNLVKTESNKTIRTILQKSAQQKKEGSSGKQYDLENLEI